MRHTGGGRSADFGVFSKAKQVIAIGSDIEHIKNIPNLSMAILADERRTFERLLELTLSHSTPNHFAERRTWALEQAAALHVQRVQRVWQTQVQPNQIRSWIVAETLDSALERRGGGLIMLEQYAVPWDTIGGYMLSSDTVDGTDAGGNRYIRAAGASEGYGVGGAVGLKLAAPDKPVVGLVGDGSMFYADSGLWTAAHHNVPVLYIISNNQSYGVVASSFGRANGVMKETGEYAGVVLDGIDPVKLAEGFGVDGMHVQDESRLAAAIDHGLNVVEGENRPFLLNVRLPLGVPEGGRAAKQFQLVDAVAATQARAA
jgi:thiamine pyrophosphate-dependent acetolactate synthase large subunit-like protein